jgi:hypothetical protein
MVAHVLQDKVGVDEVKRVVEQARQGCLGKRLKRRVRRVALEPARALHHHFGQVNPEAGVEVRCQRPGKAPNSTAEVERLLVLDWKPPLPCTLEHAIDFPASGGEELVDVPRSMTLLGCRQDRPEWVKAADLVPVSLLSLHEWSMGLGSRTGDHAVEGRTEAA